MVIPMFCRTLDKFTKKIMVYRLVLFFLRVSKTDLLLILLLFL